ncbi:MAG: hypothetical protein ABEJ62_01765, partial [Candidatus Nanohaloarchaea archaeon]
MAETEFEVLEVVDGTVEDLREYVSENEPDRDMLVDLLDAEESHKNRKTAKNFLRNQIDDEDLKEGLETAKEDVDEIQAAMKQIEDVENIAEPVPPEDVGRNEMMEAVEGTVEELKEFVRFHRLDRKQLGELLEAERSLKDRKTAKKFLDERRAEKKLAEDVHETEQDIHELEQDIEQVDMDTAASGAGEESNPGGNHRLSEAMREISREGGRGKPEEGSVKKDTAETGGQEPVEEETSSAGETGSTGPQGTGGQDPGDDSTGETRPGNEAPGGESPGETGDQSSEEEEEDSGEEPGDEGDGDTDGTKEEEESDEGEVEDDGELEEKREIADDLGVNIPDEQLREVSLEELERLRQEKEKREELIEELEDDFDEDILNQASLEDLEKIARERRSSDTVEEEEEDKDREEMETEAEEDLQMLMGAVKEEEEEDSGEGLRDQLRHVAGVGDRVREIFRRGGGSGEEKNIRKQKVLQLLDEYSDLEKKEAAIKTAHILKGYLEFKFEIEREMTY